MHNLQERYSNLVLTKLRSELVTKDNAIFNNVYEGDPKAGTVKIPVRGECTVKDYDKANGIPGEVGSTTYIDLAINKDKAINEIIDGYDASAVPDGIVADRLDSAAYGLALDIDSNSIKCLETEGTILDIKTALTKTNSYSTILDMFAKMTRDKVPTKGRYLIVAPEVKSLILQDPNFIGQGDLAQEIKMTGAFGAIGGFNCYESANLMFEDTTVVGSKKTTTELIAGHPLFCSRVPEFSIPPHLQDLSGSGKYIGASAVQGRLVYGVKVTNSKAVLVKRKEV